MVEDFTEEKVINVTWHGRGGQGAVTAAMRLLILMVTKESLQRHFSVLSDGELPLPLQPGFQENLFAP
jgi:hypothetical protein